MTRPSRRSRECDAQLRRDDLVTVAGAGRKGEPTSSPTYDSTPPTGGSEASSVVCGGLDLDGTGGRGDS